MHMYARHVHVMRHACPHADVKLIVCLREVARDPEESAGGEHAREQREQRGLPLEEWERRLARHVAIEQHVPRGDEGAGRRREEHVQAPAQTLRAHVPQDDDEELIEEVDLREEREE